LLPHDLLTLSPGRLRTAPRQRRLRWPLSLTAAAALLCALALPLGSRAQDGAAQEEEPPASTATPTTGIVSIESDVQRADNLTGVVTATGNVRIVYPDERVVATARQAQYFSREGRVVLSGDVDVIQVDGPSIRAERITFLVDEERLLAEPATGQQVFSRFPVAPLERGQMRRSPVQDDPASPPAL
jgi:lipopolysaccharide export system protein LptA